MSRTLSTSESPQLLSLLWIICPRTGPRIEDELFKPTWVEKWQTDKYMPKGCKIIVGTLYDFKKKMESNGFDGLDLSKTHIDFNFVNAIHGLNISNKSLISTLLNPTMPKNFVSGNHYNPSYYLFGGDGEDLRFENVVAWMLDRRIILLGTVLIGNPLLYDLSKGVGFFPSMIVDRTQTFKPKTQEEEEEFIRSHVLAISGECGNDGLKQAFRFIDDLIKKNTQ